MIFYVFLFLILALFVIVLIPTILFSVIRTLFSILGFTFGGRKRRGKGTSSSSQSGYERGAETSSRNSKTADGQRKKMFDKNEGEYVDFEEIKDGE